MATAAIMAPLLSDGISTLTEGLKKLGMGERSKLADPVWRASAVERMLPQFRARAEAKLREEDGLTHLADFLKKELDDFDGDAGGSTGTLALKLTDLASYCDGLVNGGQVEPKFLQRMIMAGWLKHFGGSDNYQLSTSAHEHVLRILLPARGRARAPPPAPAPAPARAGASPAISVQTYKCDERALRNSAAITN